MQRSNHLSHYELIYQPDPAFPNITEPCNMKFTVFRDSNHSSGLLIAVLMALLVAIAGIGGCDRGGETASEAAPTDRDKSTEARGADASAQTGVSPTPRLVVSDDLPDRPERIVSLAPNITEILFALGAGERVVAVTRFCDYPSEASELPKVGGMVDT
ncbi:MAG: hypothetical protein ACOC9J_03475, partial [Persicimonas sp.]